MGLSWATLVAAGVYIARYCRHKSWWLTAHIQIQTIGAQSMLPMPHPLVV
jgi:uncharacterized membrane protein